MTGGWPMHRLRERGLKMIYCQGNFLVRKKVATHLDGKGWQVLYLLSVPHTIARWELQVEGFLRNFES